MKTAQTITNSEHNPQTSADHPRLATYVTGFVLSIALTLIAYVFVQAHVHHLEFSRTIVLTVIASLAVAQLLVQLVFFLHVGTGRNRRWNIMMLLFAGMVVFILVAGSLWIMHNLDSNMNRGMTTDQMNQYMSSQDGL